MNERADADRIHCKYPGKSHLFYKTKCLVNCVKKLLWHHRLPPDKTTKSIYDETDRTDKSIMGIIYLRVRDCSECFTEK